jgi:hypothetical protein
VAVLERRSELVADLVEWCDDFGGVTPGLRNDGVDRLFVKIAIKSFRQRSLQAGSVLEGECNIGDRRAVGHGWLI